MSGFHLVTDLDGTWIPDPAHVEHLRRLEAAIRSHPENVLTFATGRTFGSATDLMARWGLAAPDHLITDVGCALWHRQSNGAFEEDLAYATVVAERWSREDADRLVSEGLPRSVQGQVGVSPTRRLALEAVEGVPLDQASRDLWRALLSCGMNAEILPSHGRYLDVLPTGVDKGFAVIYLQRSAGLPRPLVCCGDSANDLGMLRKADFPVLMGDGLIDFDAPGLPRERTYRTPHGGPVGIHEALLSFGLLEAMEVKDEH